MRATDTPLFPLNTVLFPGGVLPLRLFEPRYLSMVRRCMREGAPFGVVLIRKGKEAGGEALPYTTGTLAQIVDFDQLPDKLLGITVRGTQRFKVISSRVQSDGLHVAEIETLGPDRELPLPREFSMYANLLEQALPQMGDFFKHLQPHYDDAAWVSGRLTEILPIPLADKQRILEIDDPLVRLDALHPLMSAETAN